LALIKDKLFSFGMVLSVGFLLLISLVLSAALAYIGRYFGGTSFLCRRPSLRL
jgi:membrane protein